MPPPSDETSLPSRRRPLGRGPGTPRPGRPGEPEAASGEGPEPAPTATDRATRAPSGSAGDLPDLETPQTGAPAAESDPPTNGEAPPEGGAAAHLSGSTPSAGAQPEATAMLGAAGGTATAWATAQAPAEVVPVGHALADGGVAAHPSGDTVMSDTVAVSAEGAASAEHLADGGVAAHPSGAASDAGRARVPRNAPETPVGPGAEAVVPGDAGVEDGRFTVRLANFEGPFDLLLQLISKHKLDVTEVALSKVTDEFMAHIRAMGPDWDLDQTTEFLVVAATLLDLKAARLLPAAEVEDEADLALLEARDLLFARLLQYRAYKQIATIFEERWEAEGRRHPRTVGLEAHHAELLPEVVISIGAEGFAKLAVKAMQPKAKPQVYVDHIHAPLVSVREQARLVVALLKERGTVSFRELAEGAGDTLTVVARFLALLELYREKAVVLDQEDALGDLTVTWAGGDEDARVTDEFDQETEAPE
ncbi:segregation/condensation protein A [Streptomyces vilmorinianum]|uniref:segregation/condensation protein A n=1 Tax=Streptomyces vilmorinianum TaxID=3051092 RepID=UPI0010FB3989|nr:segregation/condensation protein A [Streptomyces vilmorinianum]